MPARCHCRRPCWTRKSSASFTPPCPNSRSTSQTHCARKATSSSAATNCGSPNRWRLKNRPMRQRRVFYHVRDGSGNFLAAANRQKMISEPRGNDENADSDAPGNPTENGKPSLPPAEPRPWLQRHLDDAFIGQDGLRSGWRLLLYLAIRKGLLLLLGVVVYWAVPPEMLPLWADLIIEFVMLVVAVAPAFLMARLEERPFGVYGLPARRAFGEVFWGGGAWGLGGA